MQGAREIRPSRNIRFVKFDWLFKVFAKSCVRLAFSFSPLLLFLLFRSRSFCFPSLHVVFAVFFVAPSKTAVWNWCTRFYSMLVFRVLCDVICVIDELVCCEVCVCVFVLGASV